MSWQGDQKNRVQSQGQAQDRTRAVNKDNFRTKKTKKDYRQTNRADLGQAEDKKGLAKGSHRGKAQFYKKNIVILGNFVNLVELCTFT